MDIKIIGFDLDNTLYPSTPEIQQRIRGRIYKNIADYFEISLEESEKLFESLYNSEEFYGKSGSRTVNEIGKIYGKLVDGEKIVDKSIEEADILDLISSNPELADILKSFSKKFKIDLVTNSTNELALKKLSKIGIPKEIFSNILTRESGGEKTDGTKYKGWLEKIKVLPENVLYVGDNKKQDVLPPKKLGINTCVIGDSKGEADFCVSDVMELETILADRGS